LLRETILPEVEELYRSPNFSKSHCYDNLPGMTGQPQASLDQARPGFTFSVFQARPVQGSNLTIGRLSENIADN